MANSNAHAPGGFLAPWVIVSLHLLKYGVVPTLIAEKGIILLVSPLVGLVCGLLPDILEPPKSPHHRGVFHYFIGTLCFAYLLVIILLGGTSLQFWFTDASKFLFLSAVAGYASHFVLDIS